MLSLKGKGFAMDLTGPGRQYELSYPCPGSPDGCSFDGVIALLHSHELQLIAGADAVEGAALTVPFELTGGHLEIIRTFTDRIGVFE
jgi:hypothetical protein